MKKKLKEAETNIPVQPDSWTVGQHNLIAFSLQLINWRHALKACHCLVEGDLLRLHCFGFVSKPVLLWFVSHQELPDTEQKKTNE